MSRPRKRKNSHLPDYTYRARGKLYYRPPGGLVDGRKQCVLGPESMPLLKVHKKVGLLKGAEVGTLASILTKYHKSPQFRKLAPRTQQDYERYRTVLVETKVNGGKRWGDSQTSTMRKVTIRRYLDRWDGKPGAVSANRRIQYLKAVCSWAVERGFMDDNPCLGVKLLKEEPRTRYTTDKEYNALLAAAKAQRQPYLWIMIELAYLCRARFSEVISYRRADVLKHGLQLKRGKGSNSEVTAYSVRLQAAIDAALAWNRFTISPWLLHTKKGEQVKYSAFRSAWERAKKKAGVEGFTFHDQKAKGITDHKDHHGGHRSDRMRDVYVRQPDRIEPTA